MAPDPQAQWEAPYVFGGWVPPVEDAAWGWPPEPPPPPLRLDWLDYFCCFIVVLVVCITAVSVLALLLNRMHMLVVKSASSSPAPCSWTALALLPTCPAPALSTPPVCYEWDKPEAAMALLGSGSADRNWRSDEQDDDANNKCFDSLVRDAAWTCDEQKDDFKAAMKYFECLVHEICFVQSYNAIPLTRQCMQPMINLRHD